MKIPLRKVNAQFLINFDMISVKESNNILNNIIEIFKFLIIFLTLKLIL